MGRKRRNLSRQFLFTWKRGMNFIKSLSKKPIPLSYSVGALLIVSLFFSAFSLLHFFHKLQSLNAMEKKAHLLQAKLDLFKKQQIQEQYFIKKLETADRYYVNKYIESLLFLEPEIKRLQAVAHLDESSKKRLCFLKDGPNQLQFAEENMQRVDQYQEVEEKQLHAVEMNEEDLKKVLSRIEEIEMGTFPINNGAPQLIIKNFQLLKKAITPQEQVYLVTMQMIKREKSGEK